MRLGTRFRLAPLIALLPLTPTVCAADEGALDGLREELASLRAAIKQLETKIEGLADRPSEFSRVVVKVVDEEGRPASGFDVSLRCTDKGQRAEASGTSDDSGLALTRRLPYGRYQVTAKYGGWVTERRHVAVEIDKPLKLNITAPSPNRRGRLLLHSQIAPTGLRGLPFGERTSKQGTLWMTRGTPEPNENNGRSTFPTVENGIDRLGVSFRVNVTRRIQQQGGDYLNWIWKGASRDTSQPPLWLFAQSDGAIRPLGGTTSKRAETKVASPFFQEVASPQAFGGRNRIERLIYHSLDLSEPQPKPLTMSLPAGKVRISQIEIYGHPAPEVLDAFVRTEQAGDREVWLRANIKQESDWFVRGFGERTWAASGAHTPTYFDLVKPTELKHGETKTVVIGRPKPTHGASEAVNNL